MTSSSPAVTSSSAIASTIRQLLEARAPTSSICPSEVARALEADEDAWRALMPTVREVAAGMQDAGDILITRGDQPVTRDVLHEGPVRLRRATRGES